MAKINAYGAHEVARINAKNDTTGSISIYVLTSDGRLLGRVTGDFGTGYTVISRKHATDARTMNSAEALLRRTASRYRLTVTSFKPGTVARG